MLNLLNQDTLLLKILIHFKINEQEEILMVFGGKDLGARLSLPYPAQCMNYTLFYTKQDYV